MSMTIRNLKYVFKRAATPLYVIEVRQNALHQHKCMNIEDDFHFSSISNQRQIYQLCKRKHENGNGTACYHSRILTCSHTSKLKTLGEFSPNPKHFRQHSSNR